MIREPRVRIPQRRIAKTAAYGLKLEAGNRAIAAWEMLHGLSRMGEPVTPAIAAAEFVRLASTDQGDGGAYLLTAEGLSPVGGNV